MAYFILIKGKKAKQWNGAIPASPKATRSQLEVLIKKTLKARYSAKIITKQQLTNMLKKGAVRLNNIKKRTVKKKRR